MLAGGVDDLSIAGRGRPRHWRALVARRAAGATSRGSPPRAAGRLARRALATATAASGRAGATGAWREGRVARRPSRPSRPGGDALPARTAPLPTVRRSRCVRWLTPVL